MSTDLFVTSARDLNADINFSLLRKTSLSLLKNNKTAKVGVKNKRLKAGSSDAYLLEVLLGT